MQQKEHKICCNSHKLLAVFLGMDMKNYLQFEDHSTTRKRVIGPGQRYQLLLQPVPMGTIGTGCNSSWYLWPSTDLVEDNWHRVVVPTGSNASA